MKMALSLEFVADRLRDKKVLVVYSGGLDSTVALSLCHRYAKTTDAISFDYGQKHRDMEFAAAQSYCERLDIQRQVVDISAISQIFSSHLIKGGEDIPTAVYDDQSASKTVVPNRNSIMLNIAAAYADKIDADVIVTGVHASDWTIYVDCRPVFIKGLNELLTVSMDRPKTVWAPFIYIEKSDIIQTGDALGVLFGQTYSCYRGDLNHCGYCPTCVERIHSFILANVTDPTFYIDFQQGLELLLMAGKISLKEINRFNADRI